MQRLLETAEFDQDSLFKPRPSAISKLTTHKRSELNHSNLDLGIYSNIKVDSYEDSNSEAKLIRLVYYDHLKKKFQLDNNGLSLLQKYSSYQVGFISIIGQKQNGKSFILDKILNLSGVKGNHFSVNHQQGIWMWSQPYRKRNMKVFLLDCQGFNTQDVKDYQVKYAQILLLLSNVTIFNHRSRTNSNDLSCLQRMVKDIVRNIQVHGGQFSSKDQTLCRNLQHVCRSQKLSQPSQQLSKYFCQYAFTYLQDAMTPGYKFKDSDLTQCSFLTTSCVNQKFVRHIAILFKSIMNSVLERSFEDINYEGSIIIKLLQHILNSLNNNQPVDMGEIFKDITKELYKSAYNYCILTYNQMLEKEFRDEEPKSMEVLLSIFGNLRDIIMEKYNQFNLSRQEHQHYLDKLEEHISYKQSMILTVNKKKTQNLLNSGFGNTNVTTSAQAISQLNRFYEFRKQLDHGRDEVMIQFCQKLLQDVVKNSDNAQLQEQVQSIKKKIAGKQNQLMSLKKKADQIQQIYIRQKESSLNNKTKQQELDRKIEMQQQKQNALYKDNSNAMAEIQKIANQFQQKMKANQLEIDQLNEQIKQKTSASPSKLDEGKRAAQQQELRKKDKQLKVQIQEADKQIQRLMAQIQKKNPKKK